MDDYGQQLRAHTEQVKRGLTDNILSFCEQYLSAGKKVSSMWHVGSPQNTSGDSLKIHLTGAHQGEGYYNREERGLGPIDLWMESQGVEFKDAVVQAAEWLRIPAPVRGQKTATKKTPPKMGWQRVGVSQDVKDLKATPNLATKQFKDIAEGSRAWKYLTEERGLDGDALRKAGIGEGRFWMPGHGKEVDCWCIPLYSPDGKDLLNVKYFALDRIRNEKKNRMDKDVRAHKGCEYHLIGMNLVDPATTQQIVLCEGEADWLSCLSEGIPALSVPFGAKADGEDGRENAGNRWIDNDWDYLEQVKSLVIAFDNDDAGRKGAATVKRRIPESIICKEASVTDAWPDAPEKSDLNDLFLQDPNMLHECIENAQEAQPSDLACAGDLREAIFKKMFPSDGDAAGYEVHGLGDQLRWRLAEWTVVTGYEKSGKTTWLNHQVIDLGNKGVRACVASLEVKPEMTYYTMFRQAMACRRPETMPDLEPDVERFERCVRWMDERIYCYKKVGFSKLSDVLDLFAYCARRYGCRVFIIDSLMMLQVELKNGQNSNDREKEMAQRIKIFCEEYDAHVFLVAHAKKAQDDKGQHRKPVRPQDVRGAGEIVNLAFNIVAIHLNDEKLYAVRDLNEAMRVLEEKGASFTHQDMERKKELQEDLDMWSYKHDSTMMCLGQRNAEGDHPKPARRLWFHSSAQQLWHERDREPEVYVK